MPPEKTHRHEFRIPDKVSARLVAAKQPSQDRPHTMEAAEVYIHNRERAIELTLEKIKKDERTKGLQVKYKAGTQTEAARIFSVTVKGAIGDENFIVTTHVDIQKQRVVSMDVVNERLQWQVPQE